MSTLDERVDSLQCKGLCQECCKLIPFPKRIHGTFQLPNGKEMELPHNPIQVMLIARKFSEPIICPFLTLAGQCSIYDHRPAICHLWGASQQLPCSHGCTPDGPLLTRKEGRRYLKEHGEGTL